MCDFQQRTSLSLWVIANSILGETMQHTPRPFASTALIVFLLVSALLFVSTQKSFALVNTEIPPALTDTTTELPSEVPTETVMETVVATDTPAVTETPIPTETHPVIAETVTPTLTAIPVNTETITPALEENSTPFHWAFTVDLDPNSKGVLDSGTVDGLNAIVENNQLTIDGDRVDQLRSFLFDSASGSFDFLGGPDQITVTLPATQDIFTLDLETRITTGYSWEVIPGDNYTQVGEATFQSRYSATGAPAIQTIKIETTGISEAVVKLIYRRAFGPKQDIHAWLDIQAGDLVKNIDLTDPMPAMLSEGSGAVNMDEAASDDLTLEATTSLPVSLDWRTRGYVTSVKDQGSCGSCWAFSSVGVLESAILKAGGPSTDISEQFLVSCNTRGFSCAGGGYDTHYWHYNVLGINQTKVGAVLEADMPYTNFDSACYAVTNHPYRLMGWGFVASGNAAYPTTAQLKTAIQKYGPIKVSVCVGPYFTNYTGGIFSTTENVCGGGTNHAVVLVGWNDSTGSWILRNSWGPGWGENGYMRIKYGTSVVGRNASWVSYAAIPAIPKPSGPSGYIKDTTPTFSWPVVQNAASYTLAVYDKTTDTSVFTAKVKSSACTSTTCSYTRTAALAKNHNYQWRLLATNSTGTSSAYSIYKDFSLTVPPVPIPSSPSNLIADTTPVFKWSKSKTATAYKLVVVDGSTGTAAFTATIKSSSCGTTACSYIYAKPLSIGKAYQWKVLATNILGNSDYSSDTSFIISTPDVPTLISPLAITGSSKSSFTWLSSPSATSYKVVLYNPTTSSYLFTQTVSNSACDVSYCTYTTNVTLTANEPYQWKVLATNAIGSSAYSSYADFMLMAPSTPVLTSPEGEISTNVPTFTWGTVEAAKSYTLAVYNSASSSYVYEAAVSLTNCNLIFCTYTPTTTLAVDTPYQWKVRASNDAGSGLYSATLNFSITVPDVPIPASPENIIDDYTPDFAWSVVDQATSYTVSLYNASANTEVFTNTITSSACGVATCSYTSPNTLVTGVNYTWKVRANNAVGSSTYSSPVSFKLSAPSTPIFLSPAGTIYNQTPTYTWRKSSGVDYYKLSIYDVTAGYYIKANLSITPTCGEVTCTWNSGYWVDKNHWINWTVTAVNSLGESAATELFMVK